MQAFWFGVIAVLWAGFFLLEGFDFGVGMLLPVVGRDDAQRRTVLRAIGPVWDGNEVWLLIAGGATFAAFPDWYASMFSGFYLAFALLLVGLILRGIGIEYRGKANTAGGRAWCDAGVAVGSLLPALLLGVAFANFVRGVRMDAGGNMTSGFFSLLNPYALLGGRDDADPVRLPRRGLPHAAHRPAACTTPPSGWCRRWPSSPVSPRSPSWCGPRRCAASG